MAMAVHSSKEKDGSLVALEDVVNTQLDTPTTPVSYRTLYRYATEQDLAIILLSTCCATASGAVWPLMTVYRRPFPSWFLRADAIAAYFRFFVRQVY
jgi:hypothetical protein